MKNIKSLINVKPVAFITSECIAKVSPIDTRLKEIEKELNNCRARRKPLWASYLRYDDSNVEHQLLELDWYIDELKEEKRELLTQLQLP